ncbi:MAG: GDP-L-fucose synthase [Candidatus Aenigmatarchaeota archaeon]
MEKYKTELLITGATGFIGTNLQESLKERGFNKFVPVSSRDFDLTDQKQVKLMFKKYKPEKVIHLAALVGGILANKLYPGDFCYKNLIINTNTIHEAMLNKVKKFMTLIGGCSYPANAPNPIKEEYLWDGYPQKESAPYSIAKKMALVQLQAYRQQYNFNGIVLIPGNVYGPYDNFSLQNSHVIPGLIHKFYNAKKNNEKEVIVWGSGKPVRDFIFVKDVTDCLVKAFETYDDEQPINISTGTKTSIKELVELISSLSDYKGEIKWDTSKPDGQMEKIFDVTRMKTKLKFTPKVSIKEGIKRTIEWFEKNIKLGKVRI